MSVRPASDAADVIASRTIAGFNSRDRVPTIVLRTLSSAMSLLKVPLLPTCRNKVRGVAQTGVEIVWPRYCTAFVSPPTTNVPYRYVAGISSDLHRQRAPPSDLHSCPDAGSFSSEDRENYRIHMVVFASIIHTVWIHVMDAVMPPQWQDDRTGGHLTCQYERLDIY